MIIDMKKERYLKLKEIYIKASSDVSQDLRYHIDNNISVIDNMFRPTSSQYFSLIKEAKQNIGLVKLSVVEQAIMNTDIGDWGYFEGKRVPLDFPLPSEEWFNKEAARKRKKKNKKKKGPKLNRPMRSSGPKKYKVYVKNPKTGNIKKINFGDSKGGLRLNISDPKARRSFVARHKCKEKKDRMKAGYWACRIGRYPHLTGGKRYTWW